MRFSATSIRVGLLAFAGAAAVFGQNVPYLRPGSIEVGPFVGGSYGIVNAQAMVGGNFTVAANKYILPYVEFTYLPEVAFPTAIPVPSGASSVTVNRNISFYDFHGGVHIRIPIHEKPYVPYVAFGVGELHHFEETNIMATVNFVGGGSVTLGPLDQPGGSDFAVNFGGGLRYYFSSAKFGMRAEVKVYKPTGTFTSTFGKAEIGLFYQFR